MLNTGVRVAVSSLNLCLLEVLAVRADLEKNISV